MRSNTTYWFFAMAMLCAFVLSIGSGCSRSRTAGGPPVAAEPAEEQREALPPPVVPDTAAVAVGGYDLESEMPENDEGVKPEDIVEEFEPVSEDTFAVSDAAQIKAEASEFDLGYRVQVMATGELEKAKALRDRVIRETGYPAYIEFEDGLYKVRIGNFRRRDEASVARTSLVELFPDCWIVQTTIRK
jgi:cell division septation protein DedD